MHPFLPNTDRDREEMLKSIGVSSYRELLKDIPEELIFKGELNLPESLSEQEVFELLKDISEENKAGLKIFAGAGAYDHYIPKAVTFLAFRSEFYTAYTPYQAEVSQGTLQAIFEYQTAISELTGMDVTNASMYDGASAMAEAALMAIRIKKTKNKILYASSINPFYVQVLKTYISRAGIELQEIKVNENDGRVDINDLKSKITEDVGALIFQHPNFYGILEDPLLLREVTENTGILLIVVYNPISLGIIAPPGQYNADIAVAEGQPLGLPLSFGGPYLGLFSAKKEYIREMPGRIIGETMDVEGKRGFVMTLQTREQHIRRERATSNICSNQNLCALQALIYLSLLGKKGIKEVALQSAYKAHYLYSRLIEIDGIQSVFNAPFFNEFVIELPLPAATLVEQMLEKGFLAGVDAGQFGLNENWLLVAVTEKPNAYTLDSYIDAIKSILTK